MKFKTPFSNYQKVFITFNAPSLTDRSQKYDSDINYIIERYVRTGELPSSPMQYLDCTTVQDFQDAMYIVSEANSSFEQLPSKIRDEFKSVSNYLEYINNPDNVQDCYNRGLINVDSIPVDIVKEIQAANVNGEKFTPNSVSNSQQDSLLSQTSE